MYVNPNLSIHLTPSFLPWCPYVCSLRLCLYFCLANRFICTIFLGSTYGTFNNKGRTAPLKKVLKFFKLLLLFYFTSDTHLLLKKKDNKNGWRASLVAQWLRARLPMQGTWVRALVREDPTCRGATKPMCHNYWACALEPACHNYWAHMPQLRKPTCLEPVLCSKEKPLQWEARAPQRRVAPTCCN